LTKKNLVDLHAMDATKSTLSENHSSPHNALSITTAVSVAKQNCWYVSKRVGYDTVGITGGGENFKVTIVSITTSEIVSLSIAG
jgi:hypothetical protein